MKRLILLYLIIPIALSATAQWTNAGEQLVRKKCSIEHVTLSPGKYGHGFPELFQEIRLIDSRPDTSRIGIVRVGRVAQNQVAFHSPASEQLSAYLNSVYSRPAGRHSLLVVLKDLWIATPDSFQMRAHNEWNLRFRVEAYLIGKDGYMPLTRMDSTDAGLRGANSTEVAAGEIGELFDAFMAQVAASDLNREGKSVSFQQIDSFNRARFAYPMDTATRFVKGVYATMDDFLNNAPSIANYKIDSDALRNSQLNIADETGKFYFTHTVWGYCDGSQPYIMMDGNLFPVFTIGHQYYVIGSKEYRRQTYRVGYGSIIPLAVLSPVFLGITATAAADVKGKTTRTLRIFRIDRDTGNVIE